MVACGSTMTTETAPPEPPGASALASFQAVATTATAPEVVTSLVEVRAASVDRALVAQARVSPALTPAETEMLRVSARMPVWLPVAVTETPSPPMVTVPWAPEAARVEPE